MNETKIFTRTLEWERGWLKLAITYHFDEREREREREREKLVCFSLILFWLTDPRGAVVWSMVCECGIFWYYSDTYFLWTMASDLRMHWLPVPYIKQLGLYGLIHSFTRSYLICIGMYLKAIIFLCFNHNRWQKSKWVWSGNTTITHSRITHGTVSHGTLTVTRHL